MTKAIAEPVHEGWASSKAATRISKPNAPTATGAANGGNMAKNNVVYTHVLEPFTGKTIASWDGVPSGYEFIFTDGSTLTPAGLALYKRMKQLMTPYRWREYLKKLEKDGK